MWNIVICNDNETEQKQLLEYVQRWCSQNDRTASVEICSDWAELYEKLSHTEPDIIIVAQDGVTGLDTITSSHFPPSKIIWFSDLDFAIQAYRLCISWFGKKPATYPMIDKALSEMTKKSRFREDAMGIAIYQ